VVISSADISQGYAFCLRVMFSLWNVNVIVDSLLFNLRLEAYPLRIGTYINGYTNHGFKWEESMAVTRAQCHKTFLSVIYQFS
jgi:hypothetical protein